MLREHPVGSGEVGDLVATGGAVHDREAARVLLRIDRRGLLDPLRDVPARTTRGGGASAMRTLASSPGFGPPPALCPREGGR